MNKKEGDSIIVYKDKPAQYLTFSDVIVFVLFCTTTGWLTGILTEFYMPDMGFIAGVSILLLLSFLFGWRLVSSIRSIIDIVKEKPLIKISVEGIEILGDKLRLWKNIKHVRLVTAFDTKYIELECFSADDNMNYMLYDSSATKEFNDLEELKRVLNHFTDNVIIVGK